MGSNPTTFVGVRPRLRAAVPGHRRQQAAGRPRPAVASRRPRTAARPPARPSARPRPAGPAARVQIYLNLAGRDPAGGGFTAGRRRPTRRRPSPQIKATFLGPDRPERLDRTTASPRAGRSSTGRSPRPRRATSRTARARPPTWRTRRAPATSSSSPTRRTSSTPRRPARSSRRRTSSASTATCRTCRTWPPTSTCGRRSSPAARASRTGTVDARSIDLAPTLAFLLGIPEPQHSQGKVLLDVVDGRQRYKPRRRSSGSTTSTASSTRRRRPYDDGINARVGGAAFLATHVRRGARRACPATACSWPAATTSARRRRTRRCSRTCRRSTSRTPGASTPRRTATTSSTTASSGCSSTRRGPTSRSWPPTSSRGHRRGAGLGARRRRSSQVNGVKVGVIGAGLEETPELVSAGATAGLKFLDEAPRIKAESERLRRQGVKVQVVVIHEGTATGQQPGRQHAGRAVGRADPRHRRRSCRTRRSTR